ncbi:MAG: 4-phosphoerythronate dehydrogenase [Planctomycetota bacterium]|nr:MAG: 4-phosphoerythronate dehydrogenase [Planctomycetota bacterium]
MKIVADANIPFVKDCFSSLGEVEVVPGREITSNVIADADVLLVRSITQVGSELLAESSVRFVGTATIGLDHVDTNFLSKNNIGFASAPGSNANSAAEYVLVALLSVAKKHKIQLEGKSIGIVGVGNVGSKVEKKAKALGMVPVLNDPPLQRQTGDAKYLPLEELFGCDFITLHTPLTFEGVDKTFHLADERFFKSLKAGSVFINTSRGVVADTIALKESIQSGRLGAVVLDVWENEPNIDIELLRVVDLSTPHIAGYSLDGKVAGMIMIYKAVCAYFGLEAKYDVADFLHEPDVGELKVDPDSGPEQDIIHQTVQQVYVINRDDFNTREIAMVPEAERAKFFDDLRKNYPVRREFHNTKVVLDGPCESLAAKLGGIGFRV